MASVDTFISRVKAATVESSNADDSAGNRADAPLDLPQPVTVSSPLARLELALARMLDKQRQSSDKMRDAADAAQDKADQAEVQSIREQAHDAFRNAMVSGAVSVAGSALSAIGAGVSLSGQTSAANAGQNDALKAIATPPTYNERLGTLLGKIGELSTATSRPIEGALNAENQLLTGEQKEDQIASKRASRDSQREADFSRDLKAQQDKMLERVDSMLDAEHQTRLAIIQKA